MRASPRTWPSIRRSRLRHELLASWRMTAIYPLGVSFASGHRAVSMDHHTHADTAQKRTAQDRPVHSVIDPGCGMTVDPHATAPRLTHQGRPYYFCSAGCRTKFAADPGKYLASDARAGAGAPEPIPEGTIYTCPMHPDIRQLGPGACPICGMALEPELVAAGPNP